ncbi:MAG: type I 3-dehydroquinate dehydratase, partial [Nitrosopumilaceae archaeon]
LAEIRFDFLDPNKVPDALELVKKDLKRCVCTLRLAKEGGKFSGKENSRISILKLISEYSPFLLDVEYTAISKSSNLHRYLKNSKTDLLVSWHDFEKTPSLNFLNTQAKKIRRYSKNVKIVTTARTISDSAKVLSLYKSVSDINLIAFAMGDYGRFSRILCIYLGSPYTYVTLGRPVAPGQFSLDEVKSFLN